MDKVPGGTQSKAQVLIENTCDDCNFTLPHGPWFIRDPSTLPPGYGIFSELGKEFGKRLFLRSELDPSEQVSFDVSLSACPPCSNSFEKINILDATDHGFPQIPSLSHYKEFNFGNSYHVRLSSSYVQGLRCVGILHKISVLSLHLYFVLGVPFELKKKRFH